MSTMFVTNSMLGKYLDEALPEAAAKARKRVGQAIFVGEDASDRARALSAGFDTAVPHESLVSEVLEGQHLVYARVSGLNGEYLDGRLKRLRNLPAVPVHVTAEKNGSAYMITSVRIAELLQRIGFPITTFHAQHNPQLTDLYLVHDDRRVPEGVEAIEYSRAFLQQTGTAQFIVAPVKNSLLLALPPEVSIEEIHFPSPRHGHNLRLFPDHALLKYLDADRSTVSTGIATTAIGTLTSDEKKALEDLITPEKIEDFYSPYVGKTLLPGQTEKIRSRHISHPQNKIVTTALQEQLKAIGDGFLILNPHEFYVASTKLVNVVADLPGTQPNSVVIVSAHLDSIALDVKDFYPAPGGDDDASGMAGVLAAAEVAVKIRHDFGPFKRTLRFILFNAEEGGVFGSGEYVRQLSGVDIAGVFQMDMIGFHGGIPTVFETHVGTDQPGVQEMSLPLAERVRYAASVVSPSLVNPKSPQMYPRPGGFDPAETRSDHRRFHEHGYPACMISEDHFYDYGDPHPDPQYNPNYHESDDENIDYVYAANIARAVAGAAILTAKS